MNPKTCNTICIVLAILIVGLIGYAAMNDGKIWGEENYRYQSVDCCNIPAGTPGSCVPGTPKICDKVYTCASYKCGKCTSCKRK